MRRVIHKKIARNIYETLYLLVHPFRTPFFLVSSFLFLNFIAVVAGAIHLSRSQRRILPRDFAHTHTPKSMLRNREIFCR